MTSIFYIKKSDIFFTAIWTLFFLCSYHSAHAARLYIDPAAVSIHRGDTVTLSVRIDTNEGECINTADATIHYDPSIRAVDVSRGNSIFSLWVEEPTINEAEHTITFAGGIPGGYCGRLPGDPKLTNIIAELVFRLPGTSIGTKDTNEASVWFDDSTQVLLNNEFGSQAPLQTNGAKLDLLRTPGPVQSDDWNSRVVEDVIPPADFTVTLAKDSTAFSGKYFVVFTTQDKQSGIDHFEIMEEPFKDFNLFRWGRADAPWATIQSPYVLKDQSLNSTIRIKAIDKAGNETIAVLVPDEALRSVSMNKMLSILLIVLVGSAFLVGFGYILWKRKEQILTMYRGKHDV